MPATLFEKILEQRLQLLTVKTHINNFYNDMLDLSAQLIAEDCPNSGQSVANACVHLLEWRNQISDGTDNFRWALTDVFVWINDNWPADGDGYELTMSKILDALWAAEPHQCLLFIPMIDAMRGAIQEKTVTTDWMAEALKHFM